MRYTCTLQDVRCTSIKRAAFYNGMQPVLYGVTCTLITRLSPGVTFATGVVYAE